MLATGLQLQLGRATGCHLHQFVIEKRHPGFKTPGHGHIVDPLDRIIHNKGGGIEAQYRVEKFVGTLRMRDILAHVLPAALRGSPYSSYLTGMLLAQCKLIGDTRCREALEQRHSIDIRTPLMEALNLMVSEGLTSLPVMQGGELVGVLRDGDLLREIADLVGNDA